MLCDFGISLSAPVGASRTLRSTRVRALRFGDTKRPQFNRLQQHHSHSVNQRVVGSSPTGGANIQCTLGQSARSPGRTLAAGN